MTIQRCERIAFVAFDGMTALDLVSVFDPLTRLRTMGFVEELEWSIVAHEARAGSVVDAAGLRVGVDRVGEPLDDCDLLVVAGGRATRTLATDARYVAWLKSAANVKWKASVCTGSILLGAAGFLAGKRATTHWSAYEALKPWCREVVTDARVVDEGDVITARGVTAGLDLGLHLCARIKGADVAAKIRAQMNLP